MVKPEKSKPSCHTCAWRSAGPIDESGARPIYRCCGPDSLRYGRFVLAGQSCRLYEREELLAEVAVDDVPQKPVADSQAPPSSQSERHTTQEDTPPVQVSEHAVFRYLEQVVGVDMDDIRRKIATPSVVAEVKAGARIIKTEEATYLAAHNTIVTTMPPRPENGSPEENMVRPVHLPKGAKLKAGKLKLPLPNRSPRSRPAQYAKRTKRTWKPARRSS